MAALTRDTTLSGRYRLTSRIATGGMGEVWCAEDTLLHRRVAVKVLKSELTTDPTLVERFRAEARNTAALSHPGIAAVHDYGEVEQDDRRTAYLVMELVEGEPLSALLARGERLPVARVLDIVGQAAAALEAAHRAGMVHRDVKPGNLLIGRDNTVKITDFGIARVADAVPLTQAGMVVGTAQYFAPEQAEGKTTTPASDVYSLGVVAYECLAGRLPFVADSSVAVAVMQIRDQAPPLPEHVPPAVRALVARAMAKDPRQRFATGGAFAAAVRAVAQGRPPDERTTIMAGPAPPVTRIAAYPPVAPPPPAPPVDPNAGLSRGPVGAGTVAGPVSPGPPTHVVPPPPPAGQPAAPAAPRPPHPLVPPGPRRTSLLVVLVGLAVLAVVLAVALLTNHTTPERGQINNNAPTVTGSNPAGGVGGGVPTEPATVTVEVADYAGRPAPEVLRELRDLGLDPVIRYTHSGGRPGSVVTVEPQGTLPLGARVEIVAVDQRPGGHPKNEND